MTTTKNTAKLAAADADYILIQPVKADGTVAAFQDVDSQSASWQITLVFPLGDTLVVTPRSDADFAETFAEIAAQLPELNFAYEDAKNKLPKDSADGILCDLMGIIIDDPEMEDVDVTDDHVLEELRTLIDEASMARQQSATPS